MGNDNGYSGSAVVLSFLLGGLFGAGVSLLMAPESGENLRRRIKEYSDETKGMATGYVDETKGKIAETLDKGKELYEEKKSAITSAIEAGKEAYEKEKEKLTKES